jgi:sporulation protein YlmC with PRC-barrel domain
MRPGKDLISKPIISITDGRQVGIVKDLYLDQGLEGITGIFVGSEGLFNRKSLFISRDKVTLFGIDAVLVVDSNVVTDSNEEADHFAKWLRREKLQEREVDTAGGTKVATVGDILLDGDARIIGFSLTRIKLTGPVAENKTVTREAMLDTGSEDGSMTIDLTIAEKQKLAAV